MPETKDGGFIIDDSSIVLRSFEELLKKYGNSLKFINLITRSFLL